MTATSSILIFKLSANDVSEKWLCTCVPFTVWNNFCGAFSVIMFLVYNLNEPVVGNVRLVFSVTFERESASKTSSLILVHKVPLQYGSALEEKNLRLLKKKNC